MGAAVRRFCTVSPIDSCLVKLTICIDQLDQLESPAHTLKMKANASKTETKAANRRGKPIKAYGKPLQLNLYEAKTQLSSLVERAAKGEEIVIAKAGKPMARLVAPAPATRRKRKWGQNLLGITYMAPDWEKDIPLEYFQDEGMPNPFGDRPQSNGNK
jgi:prevent-host-death family protein